jgi:hypothetical protein
MIKATIFVSMALLTAAPAWAANKCTSPDGKVLFQDAPCPGTGITVAEDLERKKAQQAEKDAALAARKKEESQAQQEARRRAEESAKQSNAGLVAAQKSCKNGVPEYPTVGMSEANFRGCTQFGVLFPPTDINTTETAAGVLKQFTYSADLNSGIRFVYTRNGVVSAIQR